MLLRIRWFIVGIVTSLGVATYLVVQLRRARERLTPRSLARSVGNAAGRLLEAAADRIEPAGRGPVAPSG